MLTRDAIIDDWVEKLKDQIEDIDLEEADPEDIAAEEEIEDDEVKHLFLILVEYNEIIYGIPERNYYRRWPCWCIYSR